MRVLGIESSCDETAAAVVGPEGVLSDVVYGQAIHAAYGGVVPEIASRAHAEQIVPVVRAALEQAGVERPDAVAATAGPGLIGAVLVPGGPAPWIVTREMVARMKPGSVIIDVSI